MKDIIKKYLNAQNSPIYGEGVTPGGIQKAGVANFSLELTHGHFIPLLEEWKDIIRSTFIFHSGLCWEPSELEQFIDTIESISETEGFEVSICFVPSESAIFIRVVNLGSIHIIKIDSRKIMGIRDCFEINSELSNLPEKYRGSSSRSSNPRVASTQLLAMVHMSNTDGKIIWEKIH